MKTYLTQFVVELKNYTTNLSNVIQSDRAEVDSPGEMKLKVTHKLGKGRKTDASGKPVLLYFPLLERKQVRCNYFK